MSEEQAVVRRQGGLRRAGQAWSRQGQTLSEHRRNSIGAVGWADVYGRGKVIACRERPRFANTSSKCLDDVQGTAGTATQVGLEKRLLGRKMPSLAVRLRLVEAREATVLLRRACIMAPEELYPIDCP